MRRLMNVCREVGSRLQAAVKGVTLRRTGGLLAVGALCVSSHAMAQIQTKPERSSGVENKQVQQAGTAQAALPECMEKLKLSDEQQAKAKEIVRAYDSKLDVVWKQFGEKYMATIRTECQLLAAVEDGLTEQQRTTVQAQRRRIAHAEKALEGTSASTNKASEKPADPVEQVVEGVGITLTPEQEEVADKVQQNYASHLRSLNRDIEGLHNRLVSLEADKLVELEKVLTKQQLTQLRESRQMTTGAPKVTAVEKSARISD
jgi:hypothetical protein